MKNLFYYAVSLVGRPIVAIASRRRILHVDRVPRAGAFLLVANHESIFDAMLLTTSTPRVVHWLANHEIFLRPVGRWFFTWFQARPLNRTRPDPGAVRAVVRDLRAGGVVGIFPQGEVRNEAELVERDGRLPETVARLAQLTGVPVVPCVILGGNHFGAWTNWLPLRRTRWAAAYGLPIAVRKDLDPAAARQALLGELARALLALYEEALAQA